MIVPSSIAAVALLTVLKAQPCREIDLNPWFMSFQKALPQEWHLPEGFGDKQDEVEHDVVVRIAHCSIARGDSQFIDNDWGDAQFPLVPGHEIVGIVEEVGSEVTDLQLGDRVGIGYQQKACFECFFCRQGTEQLCPSQKVIAVDHLWQLHRIGSRRETTQMLEFSPEHGIEAIVDVMPFSRINEAITRVRTRDVLMGLVLENRP